MGTIKPLQLIGYTSDVPTEPGWYYVIWELRRFPSLIYIRPTVIDGNKRITWGWDIEDDPELIDAEEVSAMMFKRSSHARH